jgi:ATP-binding cassette subfamily C protein/ATP-binding cassette subfamily C protein LapB
MTASAALGLGLGGFIAASDLAACLPVLLRALGWRGDPRHVAEALPHFAETLDLTGLRNVLATLGYRSRGERLRLNAIDSRLMPCLFVPDQGSAMVAFSAEGRTVTVFDGLEGDERELDSPALSGTAYFFTSAEGAEEVVAQTTAQWFRHTLVRYRPLFWQAFAVTFALNLLALATPLFVRSVYDQVIGSGSLTMLAQLGLGVVIALVADTLLRDSRSRILAFIGGRLDVVVGNAIFNRILSLPPAFTERATVGAQVARIRDFESVREFFTGPMLLLLFEMPYVLFFIVVIGIMGGWLAIVPFLVVTIMVAMGLITFPRIRKSVSDAGKSGSRRQEFVVETLSKMRALKFSGAEAVWLERYRDLSAKAVFANYRTNQLTVLVQTMSHVLTVAAGVATMWMGVELTFAGTITVGDLVASMILVWRVLSPLQMAFLSVARLEQVRSSIRQIDGLMGLKPERDPKALVAPLKSMRGRVSFNRVSLRYSPDADPALVGVSFQSEPGEVVAVIGRNGSGKSSVLKLIAGLYVPQGGAVRIDDMDIRQLDAVELRHTVAYVPQVTHLFFGTIAQNLRLSQPTATDADLRRACIEADVLDEIEALPQGLGTRVGDGRNEQMSASMIQKLSLARAFLRRAPITLFDEPVNGLDFAGDQAFMKAVERMRGQCSIFIVTHRPSHLRLADRVLVLEAGALRLSGPAEEVKAKLPKDFF